ncbi:hypothetical protein F5Y04DRAFT_238072 [Hypomontagnella monticulosa]|nr:hypothetical protein F5Y04DRAFT_238072 [Hypomontagnella monticulosa]
MKHHIALPTLQFAAAAFLSASASATPLDKYCVQTESRTIVPADKCVANQAGFSLAGGPPGIPVGAELPSTSSEKKEDLELETGGFGRRDDCDPKKQDCGGTGGGGGIGG